MRMTMRRVAWVSLVLIACLTFGSAPRGTAAPQRLYDGMVVFGASLSDSGNGFALNGSWIDRANCSAQVGPLLR